MSQPNVCCWRPWVPHGVPPLGCHRWAVTAVALRFWSVNLIRCLLPPHLVPISQVLETVKKTGKKAELAK